MLLALSLIGAGPTPALVPARDLSVTVQADFKADASDALDRWQPLILEASGQFGIPIAWIRAVMRAESAGRITLNGVPITSRAGAIGLMQMMPGTYAAMRLRYGLGPDPYDPRDNILAGTAYLRELYERYGYPVLFAAYNAGPAALDLHVTRGGSLPSETLDYLAAISPDVRDGVLAERAPGPLVIAKSAASLARPGTEFLSPPSLFFFLRTTPGPGEPASRQSDPGARSPAKPDSISVRSSQDSRAIPTTATGGLFVPLDRVP